MFAPDWFQLVVFGTGVVFGCLATALAMSAVFCGKCEDCERGRD